MKPTTNSKLHKYVALLFIIIYLAGCAGPRTRTDDAKELTQPPSPKKAEQKTETKVIMVEGKQYQLIQTPFGMMKRRIRQPLEKQALEEPAPEKASTLTAKKTKPSVKSTQITDKTVTPSIKPQKPTEDESKKGEVALNFDDADLYEVIRLMAELLKINYIVDPNVRGKVTIHTAGTLRKSDLFPIFYQILELNGLTALKEGNLYNITNLKNASRMPLFFRYGRDQEELPPTERIILQIIPLNHISAEEITKIITPFVSAEGKIVSHADSKTLMIVDKGINILKALRLVEVFDIDLFEKVKHRFYPLEYVDAEEMVKLLNDIVSSYGKSLKEDIKLIAIKRLNMLLAVCSNPKLLDRIQGFIQTFDVPSDVTQPRLYVYAVRNGNADELAGLLGKIFSKDSGKKSSVEKSKKDEKTLVSANPFAMQPETKKPVKTPTTIIAGKEVGSGTLRGEIKITPDMLRNSLIIEAVPSDYRLIQNILKHLDVMPKQVLIEAIIAEILLDDKTELGVEWDYKDGGGGLSATLLSAAMGASGLQFLIGQTDRWHAAFSALATEKKINILSAPTVLASDNKQANINISTEIPVVSSTYEGVGNNSGVISTNVQYRNTGIILTVTPHIKENGMVTMELSQEVSEQSDPVPVGGELMPSFFQRRVDTTLTVKHNQTIVIGGLIRESKSKGTSGVPVLSPIPGIGFLFGKKTDALEKNELIILITPRVINTLEDVDAVTEEFKRKVGKSLKQIESKKF